jgi:hypothetical protein
MSLGKVPIKCSCGVNYITGNNPYCDICLAYKEMDKIEREEQLHDEIDRIELTDFANAEIDYKEGFGV